MFFYKPTLLDLNSGFSTRHLSLHGDTVLAIFYSQTFPKLENVTGGLCPMRMCIRQLTQVPLDH